MKKILLSMLLVFTLLVTSLPICAEEAPAEITVFISISQYGEIVNCKNGEPMAYAPVSLSGKDAYTLDDVFRMAHTEYYPDGEAGYASSVGDWGLGVDMLWGDTSYNFGYQLNGGDTLVMSPEQNVQDGDYVDAYIFYPSSQSYAKFDTTCTTVSGGESIPLELYYVSGYDDSYNNVFSPCQDAIITINGEETLFVTDGNGIAELTFDSMGVYVISAKKPKSLNNETISSITAPVCVVTVETASAIEFIHNIANYYSTCDFDSAGGNLPWIIADMAVYDELFPESEYCLSPERKAEALYALAEFAENATSPGDLAKSILAVQALGYDARNIYTASFKKTNIAEKLSALVDSDNPDVTNIYTLPYVIIALSQSSEYATDEQMDRLIRSALESAEEWQALSFGTDSLTPMIFALAPFSKSNDEIEAVLGYSVEILKNEQREDGLIDGFEGYESASTGLALCAFSALGIDSSEIKNGELSLIDGLLSAANEDFNGFSNDFAREQGFRGLLSWCLFTENTEKTMYDFSDYPMEVANVSGIENCPVIFEVSPSTATVKIKGTEEASGNLFDLAEGSYTYTVSASGYTSKEGTVTVTAEDAENRMPKTLTVSLMKNQSSGGGGGGGGRPDKETEDEENKAEDTVDDNKDIVSTPGESNDLGMVDKAFSDVNCDAWYYSAAQYAFENKLISGTDKGFEPDSFMTRGMLVTILHRLAASDTEYENNPFADVADGAWYSNGVKWAVNNGIASGISATTFAPDENITREQIAAIIYRYALLCEYDTSIGEDSALITFSDKESISGFALDAVCYVAKAGIMNGRSTDTFAPKENATRAEVAAILMRFAEGNK